MRSSTKTLIAALEILARDIQSGDGVANAAIAEAAQRLKEQNQLLLDMCDKFFVIKGHKFSNYFENRIRDLTK